MIVIYVGITFQNLFYSIRDIFGTTVQDLTFEALAVEVGQNLDGCRKAVVCTACKKVIRGLQLIKMLEEDALAAT